MPRTGPLRVETDHARRYPGANKLATEAVINLIRTSSFLVAELDRVFRRYGITGAGFNVLMILRGAHAPLSPFEIGERRLVTRGTVTGLLDTLEKQELVRRRPHPEDRRMLLIHAKLKCPPEPGGLWRDRSRERPAPRTADFPGT